MATKSIHKILAAKGQLDKQQGKVSSEEKHKPDEVPGKHSKTLAKIATQKPISAYKKDISKLKDINETIQAELDLTKSTGFIPEAPAEDFAITVHNNRPVEEFLNTKAFHELIASIRDNGLLEPIKVIKASADASHGKPFEIIQGHRRYRACKIIGLPVKYTLTQRDPVQNAIEQWEENAKRDDISWVAKVRYINKLLSDNVFKNMASLSQRFNFGKSTGTNYKQLGQLPDWFLNDFVRNSYQDSYKAIDPSSGEEVEKTYTVIEFLPMREMINIAKSWIKLSPQEKIEFKANLYKIKENFDSQANDSKGAINKITIINDMLSASSTSVKPKKIKQQPAMDFDYKFKNSQHKQMGSLKANSDTGLSLKINKGYYSKELAERILMSVEQVINDYREGK